MGFLFYTLLSAALVWLVWMARRAMQRNDRRQLRTQIEYPPQAPETLANRLSSLRNLRRAAPRTPPQGQTHSTIEQLQQQQAVRLAEDPTTPSNQLIDLSHDPRPVVRVTVASNPNTPPDILVQLAKQFPHQVAANPMFKLMQLENPHFISELRFHDLMDILDNPNTPPIWINSAIYHTNGVVIDQLLEHRHLSESSLEYLIGKLHLPGILRKIMNHPNCTDRLKQAITQQLKANVQAQKTAILKNSKFYSSNDI